MNLAEQLKQQSEALSSFKKQSSAASSDDLISGVSVPVSLEFNGGKLRLYIQLNPVALENPENLTAALNHLGSIFDLDVWQPSASSNSTGFKSSKPAYKRW